MKPDGTPDDAAHHATYSTAARHFHWWTVAFVAVLVPLGVAMDWRGNDLNIWDATTNNMYSAHKLMGFVLFFIVVARLTYRLKHGAPADEPTLEPWQRIVSHLTHWGIYGLLLLVPLFGWFYVQLYPALDIFGLFNLPAIVSPNEAAAARAGFAHKLAAFALVGLLGAHVGAALFHYVIRRDGVLNRMLPMMPRRDGR